MTKLDCGFENKLESKSDGIMYFMIRIWIPKSKELQDLIIDETHKTHYLITQDLIRCIMT